MAANLIRDFLARQHATWKQKVGVLFSSSFLILVASWCGGTATVVTLKEGAANTLSLAVKVLGQYNANTPEVTITVTFSKGGYMEPLAGKLRIACDGVTAANQSINSGGSRMSVPRQPAGGNYHCTYTDEKGNTTSLTIPVPTGTLAMTSPKAGATIHLSSNVTPPPYAFPPTPTPSGNPTPTSPPPSISPTATPITGALALLKGLEVRYIFPSFPSDVDTQVWVSATCHVPAATTICGTVTGYPAPPTGTYLLTDYNGPPDYNFDNFTSGASGAIILSARGSWSPPPGGFEKVAIEYDDGINIPVVWG